MTPALTAAIENLQRSQAAWDAAWIESLESEGDGRKLSEESRRVRVRNELRAQAVETPEVARWRLRGVIGYRSEEEQD